MGRLITGSKPVQVDPEGGGGLVAEQLREYVENANVMQLRVPVPYRRRPYRDLFMELLLTRSILPLGLYRSHSVHRGALLDYVLANPTPDLILHPSDRVFVLVGDRLIQEAYGNVAPAAGAVPRGVEATPGGTLAMEGGEVGGESKLTPPT